MAKKNLAGGQSSPQELKVGPRSRPYLLAYDIRTNSYLLKLDGVAKLITDPSQTSSTVFFFSSSFVFSSNKYYYLNIYF